MKGVWLSCLGLLASTRSLRGMEQGDGQLLRPFSAGGRAPRFLGSGVAAMALAAWLGAAAAPAQELAVWKTGSLLLGLAVTPDGKLLIGGDSDGGVRVWDASSGKL